MKITKKLTKMLSDKYGNKFEGYEGNDEMIIIGINGNKYTIMFDDIKVEEEIIEALEAVINIS